MWKIPIFYTAECCKSTSSGKQG